MKNSNLKVAVGALAVVGIILSIKKMAYRKKTMKAIFEEYDIRAKTPFGFADKIRKLDDEKYEELKGKIKEKFAHGRCCKSFSENGSHDA